VLRGEYNFFFGLLETDFILSQIFTGQIPFASMELYQAMLVSIQGQRPSRPLASDELSSSRGLNDEIWNLMEACWIREPSERPTADTIVERLCALPDRPTDERAPENLGFSSQFWGDQAKHPFSVLANSTSMNSIDTFGSSFSISDIDSDSDSGLYARRV
jgi:hypothetical protein